MNAMPPPAIAAVASLRARLWDAGFRPVALKTGDKKPTTNGWTDRARRDPPTDAVETPTSDRLNTGLLCDGLRVIDLDIDDVALAHKLRTLATTLLGETLIRTRAGTGRCALIYRAAEGQPGKRVLAGKLGKIEVLGRGQQLHAYGRHPSGAELTWIPETPDMAALDTLPAVSETAIASFLAACAPLIEAEQQPKTDQRRQGADNGAADLPDVIAALAVIPNTGPLDWDRWNSIGMATWRATGGSEAGFEAWHSWSAKHPQHDAKQTRERWQHYETSPPTEIGAGTLFYLARQARPGWTKPSDAERAKPWPRLSLDLASADPLPPPELPLREVFPEAVADWIEAAAESKGAPAGYVALALLSVAGALIGNSRWAKPWDGWQEPPAINAALVGNPSAGKSPALDALVGPLSELEAGSNDDWKVRKREHLTEKAAAAERKARWEKEVKTAVGKGDPPPLAPADTDEPDQPQKRRVFSTDPTVAKAERMSAANPRGLILQRDELAGWIAGMDRFANGAGSDRAFWLQAYGGRPWTPDRVKDGDAEIAVPNLTWSILGGIQPDRLASLLLAGDDDGLSARFLYTWPAPQRPKRPRDGLRVAPVVVWLDRLRALPWTPPSPLLIPFDRAAAAAVQEWREEVAGMEADASGVFLSWIGKLPGFAVRLALIFAHLPWCARGEGDPPAEVKQADILRAITFLADYAVPMARRCFGEAALPEAERDARRLARWLRAQRPRPATLNVRELRRMQGGPGIATPDRLAAALDELTGLGWVRQSDPNRAGIGGRSRNDWLVNPTLTEASDGMA